MPISDTPQKARFALPAGHIALDMDAAAACAPGTHLVTPRRRYTHHGIYVGGGRVIHYAGLCHSMRIRPVQEVSLAEFANGRPVAYLPTPASRFAGAPAVARARSRLGEDAYDPLRNNCEHLCTWCLDGEARSEQAERFLALPSRLLERTLERFTALRIVERIAEARSPAADLVSG